MSTLEGLAKHLRGLLLKRHAVVAALCGAPGIGKTHASRALLRDAPCAHVAAHGTVTFAQLLSLLPVVRKEPAWIAGVRAKLRESQFVDDATVLNALVGVLAALAPFIVQLEDIHELSPERLEALDKLGAAVRRVRGCALLVTSRTPPPAAFDAVHLEPLASSATHALLEAAVGAPLPTEATTWIDQRAAGNPLFTVEFFRHLTRQGFIWNDGRQWHWRVPQGDPLPVTVEALIERALFEAPHSPHATALIGAMATLAPDAEPQLIAVVADLEPEEVRRASAELIAGGVFAGDSAFTHPLYREVALLQLSIAERQHFARRALTWLAQTAPEQASAFIEAAALETDAALAVLEGGAQRLRAQGRHADAARLVQRSLIWRAPEARAPHALEALRALHDVDFTASTALLEVAATLKGPASLVDAAFLAEQLAQRKRESDAQALLERLVGPQITPEAWLEWRVRLAALAGNTARALELADAHPELLHSRQPEVLQCLAHLLAGTGRSAQAVEVAARGLAMPLTTPQRLALLPTAASAHFYQGQYDEAIRLWSQGIELALASELNTPAMKMTISRAQALVRIGQHAQAETDLEFGLKLAQAFGDGRVSLQSLVLLGVVLTERGAFERAEARLLEALELSEPWADLRLNAEMALTELYRVWAVTHAPMLMHKYARQVFRHAQEQGNPVFTLNAHLALSAAELRVGNAPKALDLADAALALARQHERAFQAVSALRCRAAALGALSDPGALEAWRAAMIAAQDLNLAQIAEECRLEMHCLTGDLDGARASLTWFEANHHPLEAATARRYFPQLDAQTPQTAAPSRDPAPSLWLEVLGTIQTGDGSPVRGRKRQQLLAALFEARIAGKTEVTRLELLDALYPDEDETHAASSLKELVRSTRASLGAHAIQTTANGYALGAVQTDAEAFLETGNTALWRGAYLGGLGSGDDAVRESLHLALSLQAEQRLETDPREAARLGKLLLEADPYNLEHLKLTLSALRALGNHQSLKRTYAAARQRMADVGETLPKQWQTFLLIAAEHGANLTAN